MAAKSNLASGGKMQKLTLHTCTLALLTILVSVFLGQSLAQSDKTIRWGQPGDVPLVGDFDKDGHFDDIAIFRPSQMSVFFDFDANETRDASIKKIIGEEGDKFVVGDFDRDGYSNDIAVFKPFGRWYFGTFSYDPTSKNMSWLTSIPAINWGLKGDIPLAGDFDYDGYIDNIGVFRPSHRTWYFNYNLENETDRSSGPWGISGDVPIAGDFDGDGDYGDLAVFRPSDQTWYFDMDSDAGNDLTYSEWGLIGGLPAAGDFDGEGFNDDIVVFRSATGEWFFKFF